MPHIDLKEIPALKILQEIAKQHDGSISKQNFGTEGAELVFGFLAEQADEISAHESE